VNSTPYGLTCSIWTNDLAVAHETAAEAEAGYVWVNEVARHFLGAAFGGYKQSGIGREECLDELLGLHPAEEHPHPLPAGLRDYAVGYDAASQDLDGIARSG